MSPLATSDLPPDINGPSAWYGPALQSQRDWIEDLSAAEIAEIERATQQAINAMTDPPVDIPALRSRDFPLPTLAPRLARMLNEVLHGRGFVLIRGLPIERWSKVERATSFFGLGTHLGNARSQNSKGHVLGHVKDLGRSGDDPTGGSTRRTNDRGITPTRAMSSVSCAWLAQNRAACRASSQFGDPLQRNPATATRFARLPLDPIETDRRGEVAEGQKPYFSIPVFNWCEGSLSAIYQRKYIDSARRLPGVPSYTAQQRDALDLVDQLVDDPTLNLQMDFHPGDVQLVHNHTLLHDRTAFEDWPQPERNCHRLRVAVRRRSTAAAAGLRRAFRQHCPRRARRCYSSGHEVDLATRCRIVGSIEVSS